MKLRQDGKIFDAWITTYALTRGVFKVKAKQYSATLIMVEDSAGIAGGPRRGTLVHGHNWHMTAARATERADRMRKAKIASLEKQLAKLKALQFEGAA